MSREAVIAVNRFGLGAGPGELATAARDPRGWLAAQVARPAPEYAQLRGLPPSSEGLAEFLRFLGKVFREGRAGKPGAMADGKGPKGVEGTFRDHFLPIITKEIGARLVVAATTPVPFHERLVWFWSNHFTVSAEKPTVFGIAGAFEREAIRPHIGGRFADMLAAAAKHPAMILYLDNNLSVKPGTEPSRFAQRFNLPRATGLNENLAREILELHTLGVNGGYTQADVTAFARALTGWTVSWVVDPGFAFEPKAHEAGPKTILSRTYAASGMAQGEAVLRDLAAHPSTATHVATKLARHFIADDPPPAAVERIAGAFRHSGGHLPTVHAALLDCPEAWAEPLPKLKSPNEFVASVLRAIPGARDAKPAGFFLALHEMGQKPFFAPSPQGWPDTAQGWAAADGLWKRIEWAGLLAAGAGSRIDPLALARDTYGEAMSEATRTAITRAESRQQGLALLIASPEFQRR